jgi:hypothetical protein
MVGRKIWDFLEKNDSVARGTKKTVSAIETREAIGVALSGELGVAGHAARTSTKWRGLTEPTAKNCFLKFMRPKWRTFDCANRAFKCGPYRSSWLDGAA